MTGADFSRILFTVVAVCVLGKRRSLNSTLDLKNWIVYIFGSSEAALVFILNRFNSLGHICDSISELGGEGGIVSCVQKLWF